ncbi:MAG TPA: diacylglycerol kinase family protein [Candidatus Acidoferrum sp.]|nr:diacylglycerol kinase family protein [Candidatus Acidoferrum sp.]
MAEASALASFQPAVVFANPEAGGGRAGSSIRRIREVFDAASYPVTFVPVESAEKLEETAKANIQTGAKLLIAFGGDGTFQALANAAYGADVVLGVLPAGGGNDFASSLSLPASAEHAARALLSATPKAVDLARVKTADGRMRLFAAGGGIGIDAEAARIATGSLRRLPRRTRYVASVLRAFCGFQAIGVRAEFPGSELPAIEKSWLLAAVLNAATYGGGIRLAPEAKIDDGWLDAVFVPDLSARQVAALLPALLRSGKVKIAGIERYRAKAVKISTDRPCQFHGDGELLGPAPVEVEVVPQAIRILVPEGG